MDIIECTNTNRRLNDKYYPSATSHEPYTIVALNHHISETP